jgi:hypothetical protein
LDTGIKARCTPLLSTGGRKVAAALVPRRIA